MSTQLERAQARADYARETHRMALDLWDYIFPPWRWPEWFRRHAVVRRRIRETEAAMAEDRYPS